MYAYCRWENPNNNRYYMAHIQQDLFDDWVVVVCWGRKNTNLGRLKSVFCETKEKALEYLIKLNRVRVCHGYIEIIIRGFLNDEKNRRSY